VLDTDLLDFKFCTHIVRIDRSGTKAHKKFPQK